jgi:solute carrier family 50 (sugar transporter)
VMASYASNALLEPLSLIGPIISVLGFLAPLPSVEAALRSGTSSDLPLPILVSQLALCAVNSAYGSAIDNYPVLLTNLVGITCQLVWIACWYYLRWRVVRNKQAHPIYFILLGSTTVTMIVAVISRVDPEVIGTLSCVISICFSISPLSQLGVVVRTKRTQTIPLAMTTMMFLGNVCWGIYGWVLGNNVILLPCLLGFEISVFQLILYAWCKNLLPFELSFLGDLFPNREVSSPTGTRLPPGFSE